MGKLSLFKASLFNLTFSSTTSPVNKKKKDPRYSEEWAPAITEQSKAEEEQVQVQEQEQEQEL